MVRKFDSMARNSSIFWTQFAFLRMANTVSSLALMLTSPTVVWALSVGMVVPSMGGRKLVAILTSKEIRSALKREPGAKMDKDWLQSTSLIGPVQKIYFQTGNIKKLAD